MRIHFVKTIWLSAFILINLTGTAQLKEFQIKPELPESIYCFWCENDTTCTSDPTYKFLETEQLRAYCATARGRRELNLITSKEYRQNIKEAFKKTDSALQQRPNSMGGKNDFSSPEVKAIIAETVDLRVPTCFEQPITYSLIKGYSVKVEEAIKQLELPLKEPPVVGSLPTTDVNAYTYLPSENPDDKYKLGTIVAVNTQLIKFAYQMPKVVLPTIGVRTTSSEKIEVDFSRKQALDAIEKNPDLQINFSMAILEFLQLTEPETQPLNSKYDNDLLALALSTELFAVAHEYAHLIKEHKSIKSWQQELEADQLGIQLLIKIINNEIKEANGIDKESMILRSALRLYAPIFFFKCSELIDKAKFMMENGSAPPTLVKEEKEYVYALLVGKESPNLSSKFPYVKIDSHPPAWLRMEKAYSTIYDYLKTNNPSEQSIQYSNIGRGIIQNVDLLWGMILPRFPMIVSILTTGKISKASTYIPSALLWDRTFLYNPDLQNAVNAFTKKEPSKIILGQYRKAVQKDWLLLSGIQLDWAKNSIESNQIDKRKVALGVIALAGDKSAIRFLQKLTISTWSDDEKDLLSKSILFLDQYGKNTSVAKLRGIPASDFKLADLLCLPNGIDLDLKNLIPQQVDTYSLKFLSDNSGVNPQESLSQMALYMIASKQSVAKTFGFWCDLLLQYNFSKEAMDYALEGARQSEGDPNFENDIGNILNAQGKIAEANKHFLKSIQMGRNDGWPEMNLAKNFVKLKDLENADKYFLQAISKKATVRAAFEYAEYLNEYAWFLATNFKDDKEKSKTALGYSLECNKIINYSDLNYLDTLAECYAVNGKVDLACALYQKIFATVPDNDAEKEKYRLRLNEFKNRLK